MHSSFFNYWRKRAAFIDSLPLPDHRHEAYVLVLAAIDSLAFLWALAFQHTYARNQQRRFAEFLISCSSHADIFERVSLPYLRWKARSNPPRFQPHVLSLLETCGLSSLQPPDPYSQQARRSRLITDDPTLASLLGSHLAPVAEARNTDGFSLHDWLLGCRFGTILYTEYRCSWLHEGRPGAASHSFDADISGPTYLSNDYSMPPLIKFPLPFLLDVLHSGIDNFEHTARQANINPVPPDHMPGIVLCDVDELDNLD